MSEVLQEAQPEFWRPPSAAAAEMIEPVAAETPAMAEVCPSCASEFLLGSRFCHTCGAVRPPASSAMPQESASTNSAFWQYAVVEAQSLAERAAKSVAEIEFPGWLRYLHFHEIQRWIGLPTASLIAFVIGLACVAGALLVGLLNAKTLVDWQAIQFYRAEWLLAATAAFVAGILLKRPSGPDQE